MLKLFTLPLLSERPCKGIRIVVVLKVDRAWRVSCVLTGVVNSATTAAMSHIYINVNH